MAVIQQVANTAVNTVADDVWEIGFTGGGAVTAWKQAQIFQAPNDCVLSIGTIRVLRQTDTTIPLKVFLQGVISSGAYWLPNNSAIASAAISAAAIAAVATPTASANLYLAAWVTVPFSSAVLSANARYAIVAQSSTGTLNLYTWAASVSNVYTGGNRAIGSAETYATVTVAWLVASAWDFNFEIYGETIVPPAGGKSMGLTPSSWGGGGWGW